MRPGALEANCFAIHTVNQDPIGFDVKVADDLSCGAMAVCCHGHEAVVSNPEFLKRCMPRSCATTTAFL